MGAPAALRFGTDGVRGVANSELSASAVLELGRAAAQVLGAGRWLVGRDTRRSGTVLEAALAAGLASEGSEVELVGVAPTPAVAHLAAHDGVPAAMITASHNPYTDNGVKLFATGGRKLDDATQAEVARRWHALGAAAVTGEGVGTIRSVDDALGRYGAWFATVFPDDCLAGLRVVLDCANGAMSAVAPTVIAQLGAAVTVIHAEPDGTNINAGCGATAPDDLCRAVTECGADLGLAFDGDGDRVIAADGLGRLVDGDRLLALSAIELRDEGRLAHDTVVVTVMSNLGFHRSMAQRGISVHVTPVGDRHVLQALEDGGFSLGGEQSGHIVYRELATTGDGLLAGIVLAEAVRRGGAPLAELADAVMERYPQVLLNVAVRPAAVPGGVDVAELLAEDIAAASAALGEDGRVLVRSSGTEPVVRVMVEAARADDAERIAGQLAGAVTQRLA